MLPTITSSADRGREASRPDEPSMVIDFNQRGEPTGIEITAPSKLTLTAINRVLRELDLPPLKRSDLGPLLAA